MTAYDAGTAFLQVVPSWRGWDSAVTSKIKTTQDQLRKGIAEALPAGFRDGARAAAPEGAKAGEQFGGSFAQAVRRRIEAGLKALPKVKINADSSDTDIKIAAIRAQLEELHGKRIGIDIDEGLALAQLSALQGELDRLAHDDPSIAVRIDAARASAELAAIQEEVNHLDGETANVTVRVNEEHLSSGAGLGGLGGGFGLLGAGVAASPLAVPLGAAALGVGAGAATAASAGAGALGVLAVGLSGISSAVKDIAAANTKAGAAATASGAAQVRAALAVAAADRGLKSAQEGLSDARANAADAAILSAERVQSALAAQAAAERNLTTAQQAQKDAQQALTDARKAAQQQIEDLTQAVADGQLSQRQAALDVDKARLNMQTVNSDPMSTQLERQQAKLDYDTAVQRQKDLATQQQRTVDAQAAAVKAGVDGSAAVVTAQRGVVTANQAVADAYTAITNAAQGVADAQRAQVTQTRQSARAIEQAQNGILSAQAAVLSAQLQSATAGDAVNGRLAAMSEPLKAFATFVNDTLKPAFSGLRDSIQASLLPELQTGLTNLLPILPGLTTFVSGLAKVMGDLFVEASKALTSPFWTDFFAFVSRVAAPTIDTLGHIIGNIVTGFAGLLQAFYPVSKSIGDGILHLTERFADFATHLDSNSSFQSFLAYVKREGPAVAHLFGDLFSIVGDLIEGLAPLGAMMVDLTNGVLDLITQLGPEGLLLAIGAVGTVVALLGGPVTAAVVAVTAFAGAAAYAYENFAPLHDFIDQHVLPVLHRLSDYFNETVLPILKKIADDALKGLRTAFGNVEDAIQRNRPELEKLGHALEVLGKFIVEKVMPILGPLLEGIFESIGIQITAVIDVLGALVDGFTKYVLPGIKDFVKLAISYMKPFIDGLASAFGWVPGIGPQLKAAAKQFDAFAKAVNTALDGIKSVSVAVIPGYANPQNLSIGHQYADGGAVIGPGSWTSDSIAARLSNGEHVWPAHEVAALGGQQAMYQLRQVLTGYAAGGAVGSSPGLLSAAAATRSSGLTRLNDLAGGSLQSLHYEQHLHYPVGDSVGHGEMRAQQLLLHDLSNR